MKNIINSQLQRVLKEVGCFLRELRLNFGHTQQTLSNETGISRRSIIDLEMGRSKNLLHILRLSDFYGIDASDILKVDR